MIKSLYEMQSKVQQIEFYVLHTVYIKLPRIHTYTQGEYILMLDTHTHIEKNYVQKYTLAAFTNKKVQNSRALAPNERIYTQGWRYTLILYMSIERGPTNGRKKNHDSSGNETTSKKKRTHTHKTKLYEKYQIK